MPFGAKKRECVATAEHLEAVEWAKGLKGSAAWVIEDVQKQLELDPAAALRACPERKKIWEQALDTVPAPSAEQTAWGATCGGAIEPDCNLSLVIVEPREHPWMRAVLHNVARVYGGSGAHLYIFHGTLNLKFVEEIIQGWTGVQLRCIGKDNFSIFDYDALLTSPSFYDSFDTSHCLVFQTDVLLRRRVPAKFFEYDYVAAPWAKLPPADIVDGKPVYMHDGRKCVGNGGFSLRSVAAMRDICTKYSWEGTAKERFAQVPKDTSGAPLNPSIQEGLPRSYFVDEDSFISARTPFDRLPHNHEAQEFSVENLWHSNPCGLHKPWPSGLAGDRWYSSEELRWLLSAVSGTAARGHGGVRADPKPYEVKNLSLQDGAEMWTMVPTT